MVPLVDTITIALKEKNFTNMIEEVSNFWHLFVTASEAWIHHYTLETIGQ